MASCSTPPIFFECRVPRKLARIHSSHEYTVLQDFRKQQHKFAIQQQVLKSRIFPGKKSSIVGNKIKLGLLCLSTASSQDIQLEVDEYGQKRLAYQENGYQTWAWREHKINYVCYGEGNKEAIVLVHGFGASVYHWRYNIPKLAEKYAVYAVDLLGFGWSDKALVNYSSQLWRDQLGDFLAEVVQRPAVLAGNSVGGYAVLSTGVFHPKLVKGLVLLNAAGQFDKPGSPGKTESVLLQDTPGAAGSTPGGLKVFLSKFLGPVKKAAQRAILHLTFLQAKQPGRIKKVLLSVYPDAKNVDNLLVDSIVKAAEDPNAAEVYYRLMTSVLLDSSALSINELLARLNLPVLLLWGDLDPWMTPSKAAKILSLYPAATKHSVHAGHCPHDEKPELVNSAIDNWVASL